MFVEEEEGRKIFEEITFSHGGVFSTVTKRGWWPRVMSLIDSIHFIRVFSPCILDLPLFPHGDTVVDELIVQELGPAKFMEAWPDLLPGMVQRYKQGL